MDEVVFCGALPSQLPPADVIQPEPVLYSQVPLYDKSDVYNGLKSPIK